MWVTRDQIENVDYDQLSSLFNHAASNANIETKQIQKYIPIKYKSGKETVSFVVLTAINVESALEVYKAKRLKPRYGQFKESTDAHIEVLTKLLADRIKHIRQLQDGENHPVCAKCAKEYSNNPPYEDVYTAKSKRCYICKDIKSVGPSYKLFGFYKRTF